MAERMRTPPAIDLRLAITAIAGALLLALNVYLLYQTFIQFFGA